MSKWILVALALAVVGAAVFFATRGLDDFDEGASGFASAEPAPASPDAQLESADNVTSLDAARKGARETIAPGADSRAPAPSDGGMIEVLVVEERTNTPLAGAEIFFLDRTRVPAGDWQSVWNEERRRLNLIRSNGVRLLTATNGKVRVPHTTNGALAADTPTHRGTLDWHGEPTQPLRFALALRPDLSVVVVDGAGVPKLGVPVSVCLDRLDTPINLIVRRTNAQGIATFQNLDRLLRARADAGYAVGFAFPLTFRELSSFDPEALPDEPVRLVLPATGSVTVNVLDANRAPFRGNAQVSIGRTVEEGEGTTGFRAEATEKLVQGKAHFPYVGVGALLSIRVDGSAEMRRLEATRPGPVATLEDVDVELIWDDRHPVLVGRAVAPDGSALAERRGRGLVEEDDTRVGGGPLMTDSVGRFRYVLTVPWTKGTTRRIAFGIYPHLGLPSSDGVLDISRDLDPGENEVGDVIFHTRPLLARGRVRDAGGTPIVGAYVRVERRETSPSDPSEVIWIPGPELSASTRQDGAFEIYGESESPDTRLKVTRRGYVTVTREPFAIGSDNLDIVLEPGEDPAAYKPVGPPRNATKE